MVAHACLLQLLERMKQDCQYKANLGNLARAWPKIKILKKTVMELSRRTFA